MKLRKLNVVKKDLGLVANKFRLWQKRIETRRELERMSYRELSDIGVNRWDIKTIVRNVV